MANLPQQIASKVILHLHGQHALQSDVDEVAEIIAREIEQSELVQSLHDALEGYIDCVQYKSDYLRKKHGDDDLIAELREALAATTGGEDAQANPA